jgi:hypothetical protein
MKKGGIDSEDEIGGIYEGLKGLKVKMKLL